MRIEATGLSRARGVWPRLESPRSVLWHLNQTPAGRILVVPAVVQITATYLTVIVLHSLARLLPPSALGAEPAALVWCLLAIVGCVGHSFIVDLLRCLPSPAYALQYFGRLTSRVLASVLMRLSIAASLLALLSAMLSPPTLKTLVGWHSILSAVLGSLAGWWFGRVWVVWLDKHFGHLTVRAAKQSVTLNLLAFLCVASIGLEYSAAHQMLPIGLVGMASGFWVGARHLGYSKARRSAAVRWRSTSLGLQGIRLAGHGGTFERQFHALLQEGRFEQAKRHLADAGRSTGLTEEAKGTLRATLAFCSREFAVIDEIAGRYGSSDPQLVYIWTRSLIDRGDVRLAKQELEKSLGNDLAALLGDDHGAQPNPYLVANYIAVLCLRGKWCDALKCSEWLARMGCSRGMALSAFCFAMLARRAPAAEKRGDAPRAISLVSDALKALDSGGAERQGALADYEYQMYKGIQGIAYHILLDDQDSAVALLEEAASDARWSGWPRFYLGQVFRRSGDYGRACRNYSEALEIERDGNTPDSPCARASLRFLRLCMEAGPASRWRVRPGRVDVVPAAAS